MANERSTKGNRYLQDRDFSWLLFNERIQEEVLPNANPLLERAKFLSIVDCNKDEFIQVRYHSAYEKRSKKKGKKYYEKLNQKLLEQGLKQYPLYRQLVNDLYQQKIYIFPGFIWTEDLLNKEKAVFENQILPSLRVEAFGDQLKQKQLYLLVKLFKNKSQPYRLIGLPSSLPRIYDVSENGSCIIRLEDIVRRHLDRLLPREVIEDCVAFRILRNQDFPVTENTMEDVLPAVKAMLKKRETGKVMRIEVEATMSAEMLTLLMKQFKVEEERTFRAPGPLDFDKYLMRLYSYLNRPELKYDSVPPLEVEELMGDDLFDRIAQKDYLLYHPYHSFNPVVNFMNRAAKDPNVTRICQTLYRISSHSPIAAALIEAAQNGKEVFVLMESHARFDEDNNLYWGEKLESSGVKVCYGLPALKVHSKITLIERQEESGLRRYLHLGTGNYNDGTAKLYTDFGLLTADPQLGEDAALFFSQFGRDFVSMEEICQAPNQLKLKLFELIDNEVAHARDGKPAHILAKMNSINEEEIMEKLVEASQEGVRVDLLVRGICCLLPKVKGVTENIRVRSIVGRDLEHARAFLFENGGNHLVFLSSADWMGRNLNKRIELMFPIKDDACRQAVENVLRLQWNDSDKCRRCKKDGSYHLKKNGNLNAQEILHHDIEGVFKGIHPAFQEMKPLFAPKNQENQIPESSETL